MNLVNGGKMDFEAVRKKLLEFILSGNRKEAIDLLDEWAKQRNDDLIQFFSIRDSLMHIFLIFNIPCFPCFPWLIVFQ
jgi:hypothetical protein